MGYDMYGREDNSTLWIIMGLVAAVLIGFAVVGELGNYSGANQAEAEKEAKVYAAKGYPGATVSCTGGDSDGDGYVTCTIFPSRDDGRAPISIQCAGAYTRRAAGCRLTPAITTPQHTQQ